MYWEAGEERRGGTDEGHQFRPFSMLHRHIKALATSHEQSKSIIINRFNVILASVCSLSACLYR